MSSSVNSNCNFKNICLTPLRMAVEAKRKDVDETICKIALRALAGLVALTVWLPFTITGALIVIPSDGKSTYLQRLLNRREAQTPPNPEETTTSTSDPAHLLPKAGDDPVIVQAPPTARNPEDDADKTKDRRKEEPSVEREKTPSIKDEDGVDIATRKSPQGETRIPTPVQPADEGWIDGLLRDGMEPDAIAALALNYEYDLTEAQRKRLFPQEFEVQTPASPQNVGGQSPKITPFYRTEEERRDAHKTLILEDNPDKVPHEGVNSNVASPNPSPRLPELPQLPGTPEIPEPPQLPKIPPLLNRFTDADFPVCTHELKDDKGGPIHQMNRQGYGNNGLSTQGCSYYALEMVLYFKEHGILIKNRLKDQDERQNVMTEIQTEIMRRGIESRLKRFDLKLPLTVAQQERQYPGDDINSMFVKEKNEIPDEVKKRYQNSLVVNDDNRLTIANEAMMAVFGNEGYSLPNQVIDRLLGIQLEENEFAYVLFACDGQSFSMIRLSDDRILLVDTHKSDMHIVNNLGASNYVANVQGAGADAAAADFAFATVGKTTFELDH